MYLYLFEAKTTLRILSEVELNNGTEESKENSLP